MDIAIFVNERIQFARYFYSEGTKPFKETIALIENEQPPYVPVYSESGEPQFMTEWTQANDGIESIGLASISMLSSAMQLYLKGWIARKEMLVPQKHVGQGKGWFHKLIDTIEQYGVDFTNCPIDVDVLEQMVLARNRTQHSEDITSNSVVHLEKDLKRFQSPVFVDASGIAVTNYWFDWVRVYVDETIFNDVADTLQKFCAWLERQ